MRRAHSAPARAGNTPVAAPLPEAEDRAALLALARRGEELAGELAAARARRDALEAEAAPLAGLVADKQLNRASARELVATWDRLDADLRALKAPPAPLPPPTRASARVR
jgi:hypothetical protein